MEDDNIWDVCNSLRYGFDIEYDEVIFDDEEEEDE
jgi:hypothetical protein